MKTFFQSIIAFTFFSLVLCGIYPLAITTLAQSFFKEKSEGQFQKLNGEVRGSLLIAQDFQSDKYFWPRPSAASYNTMASSGSNWAIIDNRLVELMETEKKRGLANGLSDEMLTQSASGLDPHISVRSAEIQLPRIAESRKIDVQLLKKLIDQYIEKRDWGFLGNERVNVLKLNMALEEL